MANSTSGILQKRIGTPLEVPLLGTVVLPPPEKLVFYAGLGLLAAFQVVEWPMALVVAAGHVLADQQHFRLARGLGEALEEA